jgi:2-phospho-L-lactate guanylyltransferase
MMNLWTIVPMRGLIAGKSRLSSVLTDDERTRLNAWLLARVLAAVGQSHAGMQRCIVVSADPDALALAAQAGAIPLADPPQTSLNRAIAHARAQALAGGAQRLLVIASDLPEIHSASIDALLDGVTPPGSAIVSDESGTGTNGLLVPAGLDFAFSFGEGSQTAHRLALERLGSSARIWHDRRLAFDLDLPADLVRLQQAQSAAPAQAAEISA